MYVCGVTPYDAMHLGHARCYVTFDLLRRALLRRGISVQHVQNFTDVDDKIIQRASEISVPPAELAERFIAEYFSCADRLGILRAQKFPRVTEHIPEILELIQKLTERGAAYSVGGDVYFSVRKFPDYGKLSGRSPKRLAGVRGAPPDEKKRDPLDFALWKSARPGEPFWESPFGPGRPGWHIECSAMALRWLGENFDLHGGGLDLVFPHHENEIAQAEAAGAKFARCWAHNGFLTVQKEKMAKSAGNVLRVSDLLAKFPAGALRLFLLGAHYRAELNVTDSALAQAARAFRRISEAISDADFFLRAHPPGRSASSRRKISSSDGNASPAAKTASRLELDLERALAEDLNFPRALAALQGLVAELGKARVSARAPAAVRILREALSEAMEALGLPLPTPAASSSPGALTREEVESLLREREAARRSGNFQAADEIRQKLLRAGIRVEDTPEGPRWKQL